MAIDGKYGKVTTELGNIGENEPVVVFRARDPQLIPLLNEYQRLCVLQGSPDRHIEAIDDALEKVEEWQAEHPTKVPESRNYKKHQGWNSQVNPSGS